MIDLLRLMRRPILVGAALLGAAACNMDVVNPSVIDASTFNPNADGQTLSLSAQTMFFIAFQDVSLYGGLISEELWTGQVRLQPDRLSSRNFLASDDINADIFAPLSLAVASNENAITALQGGPSAGTDLNLARASMNLGFSLDLMAETMCSGVIQGGPELTDAQLLDSAVTRFTNAITVATAAGSSGAAIVNASNVGLARVYLQQGDWAHAAQTATLVPASFTANVITSANPSTQGSLGNAVYGYALENDAIAPALYRNGDPRLPADSSRPGNTENGTKLVTPAKFTSYGDPIRLASALEAQYISAEATLHSTGNTQPAVTLINQRRTVGGLGPYTGGADSSSVIAELLNERARDFWLEAKKLGDLRRNPSVPLSAVLMDPAGATFYAPSRQKTFGSTLCAPIPPQETNTNPNFKP